MYGDTIIYPPPYKFATRISIYNVTSNKTIIYTAYGLITGFSTNIDKYCVISVSSYSLEWFTFFSSILAMIYYLLLGRRLYKLNHIRRYLVLTILLTIVVLSIYLYIFVLEKPVSNAYVIELHKPLSCTIAYNQKICLLDVVKNKSIIHISVKGSVELYLMQGDEIIEHSVIDNSIVYGKVLSSGEYKLILVSGVKQNITLIYRKVYIVYNRDSLTPIYPMLGTLTILILIPISHLVFNQKYLH